MRRWKNFFWISAGLLMLVAATGTLVPRAVAQIRAALVREMDSPIRGTRHTENITASFPNGSFSLAETITPSIPAGKKLLVQSFTVQTYLTDSQSPIETRIMFNPGLFAQKFIVQTFQGVPENGQRRFTGNVDVDMVMNPGESIQFFVARTDNLGSSSFNFARVGMIGYLVDATP